MVHRRSQSAHEGAFSWRSLWVVASASSLLVVANLPMFLTGALAVGIRAELDLNRAQLGMVVTVMLAAAAFGSTISGACLHRFGTVNALRFSAICSSMAAAGVGLYATTFAILLAWMVLAGLGLAFCEAAGTQLIVERIKPEQLGSALGIKQACPPFAVIMAGVSVPLFSDAHGWRPAFMSVAVFAVLLGIAVPPDSRLRLSKNRLRQKVDAKATMIVLSLALAFGLASATSAATFMVDSFVEMGFGAALSGRVLAGASAVAVGVRLWAGHIAGPRTLRSTFWLIGALLCAGSAGYFALGSGYMRVAIVGAFFGYGVGNGWNGLAFLAVARTNPVTSGAAMGLVLTGGFVGALIGPLAVGIVVDVWSYREGWALISTLMVLSAATFAIVGRRVAEV